MIDETRASARAAWLIDGNETYGLRTYFLQVAPRLSASDQVELRIICVSGGEAAAALRSAGCEVVELSVPTFGALKDEAGRRSLSRITAEGWRQWRCVRAVARELREWNADVLHSHTPNYHMVAALTRLLSRARVVWHWHGPYSWSGVADRVLTTLGRLTQRMLCISNFVRQSLPPTMQSKASVALNTIDLDAFDRNQRTGLRERCGIDQDTPLVASFGRVNEYKGFDDFVEAAARVHASHPNAHFVLVGGATADGVALLEQLQARVQALGVAERFTFTGFLDGAAGHMHECSIIVAASKPTAVVGAEGFGLVVVEAMAARRPVVATRAGAFPEIVVDRETGLLANVADPEDLARAMTELLNEPQRMQAMGEAGRARVEQRFQPSRLIATILQTYAQMG